MVTKPRSQSESIVIIGNFNPAIFQPAWFSSHNLIREQESDTAKVQIIHPDAAVFSTDWLQVNVTRQRFQASTSQEPYYESVRDLIIGVFSLLVHTPLTAIGINREFHYEFLSKDTRDYLGHRLAPITDWGGILEGPEGMRSLIMQGKRMDGQKGYIWVKMEPSTLFVDKGVYIQVNDHYVLGPPEGDKSTANKLVQILTEKWKGSMQRSLDIAQKIINLGDAYYEAKR